MQINLFTNFVFKQLIIYGRQFEFTGVKVVKLGVEHYDYNTSCGNNNVQHNYSDHACLPSTVLKALFFGCVFILFYFFSNIYYNFFYFIIINSFTFKLTVLLFLS